MLTKNHFLKLWIDSIFLSAIIFGTFFPYQILRRTTSNLVFIANQTLAETAMVLIGLSFALSGITYFWKSTRHLLIYRKYLGLVGFWLILIHGIYSFINYFFIPNQGARFNLYYPWSIFNSYISNIYPYIFGLTALLIFTIMAIVSNQWAISILGGKLWRNILRIGYLAYFLGVIHFSIKHFAVWIFWFQNFQSTLLPLSLITGTFTFFVIVLRIALQISIIRAYSKNKTDKQQFPA